MRHALLLAMLRIAIAIAVVTLAVLTGSASAQATRPAKPLDLTATPVKVERRYGLEILAVDAIGIATIIGGAAADSERIVNAGLATLIVGPSIVHGGHGRYGAALGSVALRVALPIAGAALGAAGESCGDGDVLCGIGGALLGGTIGYGAAVLIDATFLARETRLERQRWAPSLAASKHGAQVGIAGTF